MSFYLNKHQFSFFNFSPKFHIFWAIKIENNVMISFMNKMEPFIIGLLVAVPVMYLFLVFGFNFMKHRRKTTPAKTG